MKNSEYWKQRALDYEKRQKRSDEEFLKSVDELYTDAQREIEGEILHWLAKVAANNDISLAEAKKLLTADEREELKWTVEEYVNKGENNLDNVFTKQMINASSKVHINRLNAIFTEICCSVGKLAGKEEKLVKEHLERTYGETYMHTGYEIQVGTGVGSPFVGVDDRKLKLALSKPWAADGKNFSDRIWKDKQLLMADLNKMLTRNIALGKSPFETVDEIAKRYGVSKSNAGRLVMTESAAMAAKAKYDCYIELGVEEFRVVETLSAVTCEFCGSMDGKHYPISEFEIGVTVPPFHPRCRGITSEYFADEGEYGERIARDLDGKTFYVPANTTYEQWKQMQDERYGEGSVDKARKMAYNEKADKEQYEKYKVIFGNSEFAGFKEFQKIKYNDCEQWEKIKNRKQTVLNSKSYEEIKKLDKTLGNKEVRLWYKAHTSKILSMVDNSLSLEEQARAAHHLRNKFRTQARSLMKDREAAEVLNNIKANKSFEELLEHKKRKYGLTDEAAYEDIIRSCVTTNSEYDKKAGLKND